jgi:hypothetical protein
MIATITITFGWWVIPFVLTVLCLIPMFRRTKPTGGATVFAGIGMMIDAMIRALWLIPIGFIWAIYFGLRLWLK